MLKIYDKNHNAIGHIVKYKDCKIESEVATGDKTLSFVYLAKHHSLQNEMYVQTKDDEYVIKEVPATTGAFPQIVAVLNLEDLQRDMWQTFSVADITIDEAVRTVLAGTGWTIGECNVTKKRNAGMMQVSTLEVIQNLCTAFMCEPVFDTINKTVSFYSQRGEDKGVYFMSGLNLKKLQKKSTSYDYYTRIIPIGQNNLSIADVNNGQNYLENYQYSDKILTYIWKDESYTDAQALMEDAQLKLNDLSKPEVSYSADVRDLAKQKSGYNVLSYNLGDTVTIIDQETGTRERQRIKKMVEYPQDPEKNTCEIANTVLTFEEMQQKYQAAINIINNTVTGEGRYTGTINVSDILNFESGIAGSSTISGISNNITGMQGELAGIKLTLGEVETNYLKVDEAELKYATIENLNVVREDVHELNADYGSFKTATADEFAAHTARIDTVVGDLASYKTTVTDELIAAKGWMAEGAIGDAQISSVNANKLQSGTIDTALVTIVGSDGRLQIADNTMQISDANRVRVQVGKDSSGDYTLAVWDKAGNLIWDALGATDKTIQRKIIRDNVIADDAAIQALKIDFQSLDTVLTDQGVTISGTVVQVGSKTLNVALSEQAQINTNYSEQLTSHSSKIAANEKAIALKVSSQTYEKDKTSMESSLQTLESSVNVMDGQITALVQDVTVLQGDYDGLDSRTAKLELDSSNFAVELSSTKKTVSDNYTSLKEYTDSAKASAISTAASDATTKADNALAAAKTDATTKANAALASAMTEIDATNAVVTTHTTTLSKHDTRITANENAISLKVWSQDITDAVAGIEVGGRNLLLDSKTLSSKHWYTSENPTIDDDGFSYVRLLNTWNNYIAQTVALEIGKYTFSFYAKAEKNETLEIKDDSLNQYVIASISINDSSWKKYTVTAKITKNTANPRISFLTRQNTAAIYIKKIKLERGTKATDWTPAPEDVDSAIATVDGKFASYSTTTEMQSAIEVAKSEINLSVSETYSTKSELKTVSSKVTTLETWKTEASQKITKDGIIATVGNYYAYQSDLASAENRITDAETTIAQQADAISLKVSKGDIISTINQSAEEVKINAAKITLEGATIADSFTATNLTVTGNSVFSGKLSGATGDFSGKITATSGKIGDWNIGGSINATNSKGNYIYLGAGTSSNQDVLYVRTGTDSSSYKWPIILRATGEAIFSNATVTGNITATSIKLSDTVSIYKPSTSQYVTLINQASENINLGLMFSSITTPNIVSTGSVWAQNTTYGGQFNAVSGDYGVMLRNDGNAFYILLSNAGDQTSFNALRPLFINLTDGKVTSQTEFWCTCHGVSGTRRPVVSASTNGTRVSYIASKTNSSGTHFLTVNGQYGTEGSTYNSYNISCTTSDARLKTNVLDTDINALAVINQMQIRQFNWKENGIHQKIGFVADELELLDPALAIGGGYDEDGVMDVKSVNDFYLLGYLTKGIQELYSAQLSQADKLFTHKSQIDYLLDENAALKKRVKELEKQIA